MKRKANSELFEAERGVNTCSNYDECSGVSSCSLKLSSIEAGDRRRGSRDPKVLLVTEAPDEVSSQGSAYQGSTSDRIISFFCDERYGISIGTDRPESFENFLMDHRFYATSSIKCCISDGDISNLHNHVVSSCRQKFLDNQIQSMDDLELIIPMGKIATASVLHRSPSSISLTKILGKRGQGILKENDDYGVPVVVFPHPSGASPLSNPPIVKSEDGKQTLEKKAKFQNALEFVREVLGDSGYDVLPESPEGWDHSTGLSKYLDSGS